MTRIGSGILAIRRNCRMRSRAPASDRYDAGGLHRWLLGSEYRDLWTTPLAVEVLDLATFGGAAPMNRSPASQSQGPEITVLQ